LFQIQKTERTKWFITGYKLLLLPTSGGELAMFTFRLNWHDRVSRRIMFN